MVIQIICNVIMFVSNITQVVYDCLWLRRLSKKIKSIAEECRQLSRAEALQYIRNIQKNYTLRYIVFFLVNLVFLIVGILTCYFDGLSDWENYKIVVFVTFFVVLIDIMPVFVFLTKAFKYVYKVVAVVDARKFYINIYSILCALVCLIFSFNCALSVYTVVQCFPSFFIWYYIMRHGGWE